MNSYPPQCYILQAEPETCAACKGDETIACTTCNGKRTTFTGAITRQPQKEHLANWERGPAGEYLHHLKCSTCGEEWNPRP